MITDSPQAFLEDITKPNDWIRFAVQPAIPVAAEIWTNASCGNVSQARSDLLQQCISRLRKRHPSWALWLLAAHKALQPDSSMVRHYRLWASLARRGIAIPTGKQLGQGLRTQDGRIRFFGAIELELNQLHALNPVMETESAVVAFGDSARITHAVEQLATNGWSVAREGVSEDILNVLCPREGSVLSVFGEFDDREVAVAIMGAKPKGPGRAEPKTSYL